jgi:ABC-type multidrug transport system permease subunit
MDDPVKAKKFLLIGAIIGGIISLAISLLMDTMYAGSFQGTWRDAIATDLNTFFSLGVSKNSILVNIMFVFVLGILTAFGAFLGFIFSFFLYKFFSFLSSK